MSYLLCREPTGATPATGARRLASAPNKSPFRTRFTATMAAVLRLLGIVISIGLADSLNPTTIAPALYLSTAENGRAKVLEFTAAVFSVYFLGGLIVALGPGQLLFSLIPHPHHRVAYLIEVVVGVVMFSGGAVLWRHRERLAEREPPEFDDKGRGSWILGATITAIELPTAFPYFAAIAAIVGADINAPSAIIMLLVFNVCFVLPLLAIAGVLSFTGDGAQQVLCRARSFLHAHWPRLLASVAMLVG